MAELVPSTSGMPAGQNQLTTQRLDYDGQWVKQVKVRESTTVVGAITPQEAVSDGIWTSYHDEPISDILVFKVTETRACPGLYVPRTRDDLLLGPIGGTRRLVENSGLTTLKTATYSRTYDAHENSQVVCWELVETNSDGTGSAGNPAFPIRVTDLYDNERGAVQQTSQIIIATNNEVGSLTVSGGTATLIRYEPQNQFHLNKITETWAVPGPLLRDKERYDERLGYIASVRHLVENTGQTQLESNSQKLRYDASPYGEVLLWEIQENWITANFPIVTKDIYDDQRGAVQVASQYSSEANPVASLTISSGIVTQTSYNPVNEFLTSKNIETWAVPGPLRLQAPHYEPDRGQITSTAQLVDATGKVSVRTATAETSYRPSTYGAALVTEIIEDWLADMPNRPGKEYDEARGAVAKVIKQVPIGGSETGSIAISGTTITQISYQPLDEYQLTKLTETWEVPGKLLRNGERYDLELGLVTSTRQLVDGTANPAQVESAGGLTKYETSPMGFPVLWQIVESWNTGAFPAPPTNIHDRERGAVERTPQLTTDLTTDGSLSASGNVVTEVSYEARNAFLRKRITETWAYPGPLLTSEPRIDDDGAILSATRQLNIAGAITEGEAVASGIWTMTTSEPYSGDADGALRWKITQARILDTGTCPILRQDKWNDELGTIEGHFSQYVPSGTAKKIIGSAYSTADTFVSDSITALTASNPGSGYTTLPTLTVSASPGGGTLATGTVTNLVAVSAALSATGSGYTLGDVLTGTLGTGTKATFTLSGGSIATLALNAAGTAYTVGNTVTLAGGTFSVPATITVSTIKLVSLALTAGGAAYAVNDTITLTVTSSTSTTKAIITVLTVNAGAILTFSITTAGSYTVGGTAATQFSTSGGGTGATFQTAVFGIATFAITAGGAYTVPAVTTFTQATTSGSGTGATFQTATYTINVLTVLTGGAYTVVSTAADPLSGGTGTGLSAVLDFGIGAVALSTPGFGGSLYYYAPTITPAYGNATIAPTMSTPILLPGSPAGDVVDTGLVNTEHALIKRLVWTTMPLPPTRVEYVSKSYPLPSQFAFLGPWEIPRITGFLTPPPFPGVHYTHTLRGVSTRPARMVTSYSRGPSGNVPKTWQVITPGTGNKIESIGQNTIHNAIVLNETGSAGTLLICNLPASTPSSYTPGQVLIVDVSEKQAVGNYYCKQVMTIQE